MGMFLLLLAGAASFVCGGTDAVNSVSPAVASGAVTLPRAARLAAAAELLGALGCTLFFPRLAQAVSALTAERENAVAALLAVVVFASLAWAWGLPTSESHALVSALWGASAVTGHASGADWGRILLWLCLSLPISALLGGFASALAGRHLPSGAAGRRWSVFFLLLSGFAHGAQDAQKFAGLLLGYGPSLPPFFPRVLPPAFMALGTLFGGHRSVETVSAAAGRVDTPAALGAECASGTLLLAASALGLPLSTTQVKTAALVGAARARGGRGDARSVRRLLFAWVITFPAAAALGWLFRQAMELSGF